MKALLVTKEYRRPIGIIDIGPQVQSYFKGMQLMEVYTYEPPSVRFAQLIDTDPMPAMSKVHLLEATYMHGLGPDPLLTIHALNQNTETCWSTTSALSQVVTTTPFWKLRAVHLSSVSSATCADEPRQRVTPHRNTPGRRAQA